MSCMEWQDRLDAYVDAELPPHEMELFRAHAATLHGMRFRNSRAD